MGLVRYTIMILCEANLLPWPKVGSSIETRELPLTKCMNSAYLFLLQAMTDSIRNRLI